MNPYHFENMKNSISFSFFKKKIARLMTGTKVGTVEEDEVTDNAAATMVRMPASVQRLNDSKDVIKYWKHDMSCMKMICDYKVHREPLSTVGKFLYIFYMN